MMDAIQKFQRSPKTPVDYISVKEYLWTSALPSVDLVVRAGGEPHWSGGFMMWHTTDSQFYFTKKFWPDFDPKELQKALSDYASRERRFGK
jgi:undecaprenyl diphosphate synthase